MTRISIRETLSMAFSSVWTHRFRSGLTILGIVIGITTVVTVAALLTGLRKSIVEFFEEFGPNSIFVARVSGDPSGRGAAPKELKRRPLTPEDAEYLKQVVRSIDDVGVSLYYLPPAGSFLTAKIGSYETENISIAGAVGQPDRKSRRASCAPAATLPRRKTGAPPRWPSSDPAWRMRCFPTAMEWERPFWSMARRTPSSASMPLPKVGSSARTALTARCSFRCKRRACAIRNRRTSF